VETRLKTAARESSDLQTLLSEKEAELQNLEARHARDVKEKSKRHTDELKEMHEMLKSSTLEVSQLNAELAGREQRPHSTSELKKVLRDSRRRRADASNTQTLTLNPKSAAAKAREDAVRLQREVEAGEKEIEEGERRHKADIRGLCKQMQFLRARVGREERFREGLGYQKRWFLMEGYAKWYV